MTSPALPHVTSPHPASPRLASPRLTSPRLTSPRLYSGSVVVAVSLDGAIPAQTSDRCVTCTLLMTQPSSTLHHPSTTPPAPSSSTAPPPPSLLPHPFSPSSTPLTCRQVSEPVQGLRATRCQRVHDVPHGRVGVRVWPCVCECAGGRVAHMCVCACACAHARSACARSAGACTCACACVLARAPLRALASTHARMRARARVARLSPSPSHPSSPLVSTRTVTALLVSP